MGYWDTHPLAGDEPEDSILTLAQEFDLDDATDPRFRACIAEICSSVAGVTRLMGLLAKCQYFVLPFLLAHLHIRIADREAIGLLKELIGDGGAEFRGYSGNETDALRRTPLYYAEMLDHYWEGLMSGAVPFEQLAKRPGLLDMFNTRAVEDEVDAMGLGSVGFDD